MPDQAIGPIARSVQEMEEEYLRMHRDMREIRTTLLVNFGPEGRIKSLVTHNDSTQKMLYTIVADLLK